MSTRSSWRPSTSCLSQAWSTACTWRCTEASHTDLRVFWRSIACRGEWSLPTTVSSPTCSGQIRSRTRRQRERRTSRTRSAAFLCTLAKDRSCSCSKKKDCALSCERISRSGQATNSTHGTEPTSFHPASPCFRRQTTAPQETRRL